MRIDKYKPRIMPGTIPVVNNNGFSQKIPADIEHRSRGHGWHFQLIMDPDGFVVNIPVHANVQPFMAAFSIGKICPPFGPGTKEHSVIKAPGSLIAQRQMIYGGNGLKIALNFLNP